jgi:hypothetical protein
MTRAQLRRLHGLWRSWTGDLGLAPEADRALRHYYVALFTNGRAVRTTALTQADAALAIEWLEKLVRRSNTKEDAAAGTAGRQGFPERKRVHPNAPAWRTLFACARALGMDRERLDAFIRKHYAGVGLHSVDELQTMADLNRVLWGLKAILRRGPGPKRAPRPAERKAA